MFQERKNDNSLSSCARKFPSLAEGFPVSCLFTTHMYILILKHIHIAALCGPVSVIN